MKKTEPLTKHTLNLREGDVDRLKSLFPEVGAAYVIRKLVSDYLDRDTKDRKIEFHQEIDV
jgi:hypothetical protein